MLGWKTLIKPPNPFKVASEPPFMCQTSVTENHLCRYSKTLGSAQRGWFCLPWRKWNPTASRQIYIYMQRYQKIEKNYSTNYLTNLGMRMRAAWDFSSGLSSLVWRELLKSQMIRDADFAPWCLQCRSTVYCAFVSACMFINYACLSTAGSRCIRMFANIQKKMQNLVPLLKTFLPLKKKKVLFPLQHITHIQI